MTSAPRGDTAWIATLLARQPSKNRYKKFYDELDRLLPSWERAFGDPRFVAHIGKPDTVDGANMLHRMQMLWTDPLYNAPASFVALTRLSLKRMSGTASQGRTLLQKLLRRSQQGGAATSGALCPILCDRYELLAPLGRGGNGEVFLAWSRETKSLFAVKLIRAELSRSPEVRSAFKSEALKWIALGDHPHILKGRFFEEIDGQLIITMQYVEDPHGIGASLADKITVDRISNAQIAQWFTQAADGLSFAYESGITAHRDIKPGNILITPDGDALISDFGLAVTEAPVLEGIIGTPHYMAPEQFFRDGVCSQQSDMYSLGVSLYQATSGGQLPFVPTRTGGSTERQLLEQLAAMHVRVPPPVLPTSFWPVIERCLAKNPAGRYNNIGEFRQAVAAIAASLGLPTPEKPKAKVDVWTLRDQGNTFMRLGRYDEAIAAFDAFLDQMPDMAAALNRACCLENVGRYGEAFRVYEKLAADGDAAGLINGSNCLHKMGVEDQALSFAHRAVELHPSDPLSWIALGNRLYTTNSHGDAMKAYLRAHELDPKSATPLYNLGLAALQVGLPRSARSAFEDFLSRAAPDDSRRAFAIQKARELGV